MLLKNIIETIRAKKYPNFIKSSSYQIYCDTLYGISDIKFFYYCIYKNNFLNGEESEKLLSIYIDSKKILNIINRFTKKIKYKLYKKYEIDKDLRFIPLKNYDKSEIVYIIENKTVYSFRILDLINLWKISLYSNENMFPSPNKLKNPFTNIVFKKYNLYNIFISFSKTNFIIPDCILAYYKCNFDMYDFKNYFFPKLQYNAIESYSKEGPISQHHDYIVSLLHDFRKITNYAFVETSVSIFKKMKIVDLLRNILSCYLKQKFLCNTLLKEKYEKILKKKLRCFFEKNSTLPYFFFLNESEINRYENNSLSELTEDLLSETTNEIPNTIIEDRRENSERRENRERRENSERREISTTNGRSSTLPLLTYNSNSVYRRRRSIYSTTLPPIIQNTYSDNTNPFQPSSELSRSPVNSIVGNMNNYTRNTINIQNVNTPVPRLRNGLNFSSNIYSRLSLGL